VDDFLFHYNEYPASNSVIIINNVNIYCDLSIADVIRVRGYLIRYLPLYSFNYNSIEFSFSILKSWIRRHFYEIWLSFESSFENFLIEYVINSRCNRYGEAYFRYNDNGNYIFNGDLQIFNR
jgi:transposase